eukprot:11856386-Heterocapsa_arctica.AAC.1
MRKRIGTLLRGDIRVVERPARDVVLTLADSGRTMKKDISFLPAIRGPCAAHGGGLDAPRREPHGGWVPCGT